MIGLSIFPLPDAAWQALGVLGSAVIGAVATFFGRRWWGERGENADNRYLWTELRKARADATYWYDYSQQLQRLNDALAHHAEQVRTANEAVE